MAGKPLKTPICTWISVSLLACVFVWDNGGCKNNNCNLQKCGTALCSLIGFEMPLLIFIHLPLRHSHQNKRDASAFSVSLHSCEIHGLQIDTVVSHSRNHILCMYVCLSFLKRVCVVWTSIHATLNGFSSSENHYNRGVSPQPQPVSRLIPSSAHKLLTLTWEPSCLPRSCL